VNKQMRQLLATLEICVAMMLPINMAVGKADNPGDLSAQWWQWSVSIPTTVNPLLDTTGADCMVGQRDDVWFLAGTAGGGTVTRSCSVPEGVSLFFPIANSINVNTPNVCGQDSHNIPVKVLREASADFIRGVSQLQAELDGRAISLQRIRSDAFEVALPEHNIFDAPCSDAGLGNVPAGIYSPAVDEGFYAFINPLRPGNHTLHFHAENQSQGFVLDVTYHLTVVPVSST
jgi:hypothetical protein